MRRFVLGLGTLALLAGCGGAMPEAAPPQAPPGGAAYPSTASMQGAPSELSGEVSFASDKATGQLMAAPPPPPPPAPAAGKPAPVSSDDRPQAAVPSKQQLVYTADFTLAVYQVEIGLDKTEAIARDLGGYLSLRGDDAITVRIPREKFREALARVEKLGDVLHRDVKAIDVTDEFVDLESRLKNARIMRDHLQALLSKAAVKDALEIEKELGRVTESIEVMEGKLKMLSDRIAFSTITVHYSGKGNGSSQPNYRLPFVWVQSLGVHRLLSFQSRGQ